MAKRSFRRAANAIDLLGKNGLRASEEVQMHVFFNVWLGNVSHTCIRQ